MNKPKLKIIKMSAEEFREFDRELREKERAFYKANPDYPSPLMINPRSSDVKILWHGKV